MRVMRWMTHVLVALCCVPAVSAGTVTGKASCGEDCANQVVYLEGVQGSYSGEGLIAELGQKNKVFVPHVLPVLVGSTLRIGNQDPFLHNVHAYDDSGTAFNHSIPVPGMTQDQVIEKAGVYALLCDAHPEMSAYIVALENPFFSRLDEAGGFQIAEVPEGEYTLVLFDADRDTSVKKAIAVGAGEVAVEF